MADSELQEAEQSLSRIQNFDSGVLSRVDALGSELNFLDAVDPAERIIGLFKQISSQHLNELPPAKIAEIKALADSAYSLFEQILKFDPKKSDSYTSEQI